MSDVDQERLNDLSDAEIICALEERCADRDSLHEALQNLVLEVARDVALLKIIGECSDELEKAYDNALECCKG